LPQARSFSDSFFTWYKEHRHSGIAMLTPEMLHYGRAEAVIAARRLVLEEAYRKHPERFVRPRPMLWMGQNRIAAARFSQSLH
jgi:putative transposase